MRTLFRTTLYWNFASFNELKFTCCARGLNNCVNNTSGKITSYGIRVAEANHAEETITLSNYSKHVGWKLVRVKFGMRNNRLCVNSTNYILHDNAIYQPQQESIKISHFSALLRSIVLQPNYVCNLCANVQVR